jgi:hypothetical protein
MATGTLNIATAPGTITVVTDPSGQLNPGDSINFDTLPPNCKVNQTVMFDIDNSGRTPLAINITPDSAPPVDPNFPYNNQFPGATIINAPQTGDLTINGTTTIIEGVTLTGNVKVTNGGTIVIKSTSPTSTVGSVVTGHIHANDNTTVIIYNSTIGSSVAVAGASELKIVKGTVGGNTEVARTGKVVIKGTVGGNTEIARSGKVTIKGTVGGNTEISANQQITIDALTVQKNVEISSNIVSTIITNLTSTNGNIEIQGNTGCSYTNILAPHGQINISGCNKV